MEKASRSNYVLECAMQNFNEHQHWYYYCNRSGTYTPRGQGKRQLKSQGTCKTGEKCISHMKVSKHLLAEKILVEYCSTHHNHEVKLGHLRMSQESRLKIAAQLQQGVTFDKILDHVRDDAMAELNREHLVTKQDIP